MILIWKLIINILIIYGGSNLIFIINIFILLLRNLFKNIWIFYFNFIIIKWKSIIIQENRHILIVKFLLKWYIVEINIISKMIWLIYNCVLKFLFLILAKICIWISFHQRIISRKYTLIFFFSITAKAVYFLRHTQLTLFFWKTSCHYNTVISQNFPMINICIINIIIDIFFLKKIGKFFH